MSAAQDDALPLTRQVAQEAMRLYPPAPILVRTTLKPTSLQGHPLRKGQVVIIATYAMHRHHQLWDHPARFDPARFNPDATTNRSAFLPFGAGPRMCIAAQFALTEIAVIVAELAKLFHFMPTVDVPDISLVISTHARNGLRVRARSAEI
jgi:cytochrome P450